MFDVINQPNGTMCGYVYKPTNIFEFMMYWNNYFNSPPADFLQGIKI
jgi:hypothetical protein